MPITVSQKKRNSIQYREKQQILTSERLDRSKLTIYLLIIAREKKSFSISKCDFQPKRDEG